MTGNPAQRRRSFFYTMPAAVAVWLCLASLAIGQATSGWSGSSSPVGGQATLQGRALDTTRAAIAGARITAIPDGRSAGLSTLSGPSGEFSLTLEPGNYTLQITADGFEEASQTVKFTDTGFAFQELVLQVAPHRDMLTVNAEAPPVQNAEISISQAVDDRRLTELPSNGRQLNRFALLDPHVRNSAGLGGDGTVGDRLAINANSFRYNFYLLDGNTNSEHLFANSQAQNISVSAVQEFKVLTNAYSAEYGRSTAGILSTTTKSGTGHFHGEGFFLLRPSGPQAAPVASNRHVPNELEQLGGSVGGPLAGDRTTFFANYERLQRNRGAFVQSPIPLSYTGRLRQQLALVRLDHRWSDTNSMALRLNGDRTTDDNPSDRVSGFTQPSAAQLSASQATGGQLSLTTAFGSAVNQVRASYINTASPSKALYPQVAVVRPSFSTEGGSSSSGRRVQTYQVADQVVFGRAPYVLKIGGDVVRNRFGGSSITPFGEYRFAPGPPTPGQQPIQYTQTFGTGDYRFGETLVSAFAQADWQVAPRFTTYLGLRYEYQSTTDDRNNVTPRLGFAFDVTGDGKTIVRGGAGIFYDLYFNHITRQFFTSGVNSPTATFTIPFGAPGFPLFPNSLSAPPSGAVEGRRDLVLPASTLLNPYGIQTSLGVQRLLPGDWTMTANVMHSHTLKQMRPLEINAPAPFLRTVPGQRRSAAEADATRPLRSFSGVAVRNVRVVENSGSSLYDALDLGLSKRLSKRFQVEGHYVYSSAITYSMFFGETTTGVPNDWGDRDRGERGRSDYHQRHRFVAHTLLELPFHSQLSAVTTIASGLPVNPLTGVDNNGDTNLVDRPAGLGRNSFQAPGQSSVDVSFAKRFAIREPIQLELRAEVFNLFNHSNLIGADFNSGGANNIYGDGPAPLASFLKPVGGLRGADPARQIQFVLRLLF